jgi:hypothetical protein
MKCSNCGSERNGSREASSKVSSGQKQTVTVVYCADCGETLDVNSKIEDVKS